MKWKYLSIVLTVSLLGFLNFYLFFTCINKFDYFKLAFFIITLFIFVIFESILFTGAPFYITIIPQFIISFFIFLCLLGYGKIISAIFTLLFIGFQMYAYLNTYFILSNMLKISWGVIFRNIWFSLAWFFTFLLSLIIVLNIESGVRQEGFLKNFISYSAPLLKALNLPPPEEKLSKLIEKGLQESENFQREILIAKGLEEFNKKFNLNLRGHETISEVISLYMKRLWLDLSPRIRLIIKILVFAFIVAIIHPLFGTVGTILSWFSTPIFSLLEKIGTYSKDVVMVEKEKILI